MEEFLLAEMRKLDDPYRLWNQPDDGVCSKRDEPTLSPSEMHQAAGFASLESSQTGRLGGAVPAASSALTRSAKHDPAEMVILDSVVERHDCAVSGSRLDEAPLSGPPQSRKSGGLEPAAAAGSDDAARALGVQP